MRISFVIKEWLHIASKEKTFFSFLDLIFHRAALLIALDNRLRRKRLAQIGHEISMRKEHFSGWTHRLNNDFSWFFP